ncbi:MAG TPA: TraR/DksA family transcriptional regulator [Candidatus Binataceae bacterium]|nr:TraR/DksA family transcriptional regulator [Candidatus Binataceae bacterium]
MLERLRNETLDRVRELRSDQAQESETEPADEMDTARATAEVETHAALIARAEEKLNFLDEAMVRLEQGKYGICLGCHGPIALERLLALPFAAYCVDCQQKRNSARPGWGEGTMIPPYDHLWTLPEEMEEAPQHEYRTTASPQDLEARRSEPAVSKPPAAHARKHAAPGKKRIVVHGKPAPSKKT